MKLLNRTLLGVISCFLLSAGLSKAAQQLDPLTKSVAIQGSHPGSANVGAMTCSEPCFLLPGNKADVGAMTCSEPCFYLPGDKSL
jgi:hypothetical protein